MDIFCQAEQKLKAAIIERSAHFYLLHDGFPLAKGHLILIPREHRDCFLHLTSEEEKECAVIREKITGFFRRRGERLVMFEHGAVAQTVPHAHLHFLPTEKSIRREIEAVAIPMASPAVPYLYYDDGSTPAYYRVTEELIPGFLHTTFARILGRPTNGPDRAAEAGEWIKEIRQAWEAENNL